MPPMGFCGWPLQRTVLSTLRADAEVSLPSSDSRLRHTLTVSILRLILIAQMATACSKASSPSAPDQRRDLYLGTWTGTVNSSVIGQGSATIVLDSRLQTAPNSFALISGRWSFVFPDSRFSASGTVSGGVLPDGSYFVLLFSGSTVPCPNSPGGVNERGRSASLVVQGNRMSGDYIDNGCPGGFLDLVRM